MKINYQIEMEHELARIAADGRRPRLLLHSCCAPCSSSVLEQLCEHFDVTILWYNPNIYPLSEYEKRLAVMHELLDKMGLSDKIGIIEEPWQSEDYFSRVEGFENEPEGGARCAVCFRLRMEKAAETAKRLGFDYFCTTLTLSRHKDAVLINNIGEDIEAETGMLWLPSDFKKRDGENRSIEMCEQFELYRQLYCGCKFSLDRRQQGDTE